MALADNFCSEIKRVLANKGRLAIIECKKEDQPWGPPKEMRISHLETEDFFTSQGFSKVSLHDLGFTYLLQFEVKAI